MTFSKGSHFTPSTSLKITSGRDTPISKPSRRMFSMSTDKCSSPRPETLNRSGLSVGSTRRATLWISSFSRRSLMLREVTYLPSRPANGELLTWNVMLTVGSSTESNGNASTHCGSHSVSEMPKPSMPVTQMMSPASASGTSTRFKP